MFVLIVLISLITGRLMVSAAPSSNQTFLIGVRAGSNLMIQGIPGAKNALLRELSRDGVPIKATYETLDMIAAQLSPEIVQRLAKDPRVRYIVPDGRIASPERFELRLTAESPVELYPWGVKRVHAPEVQKVEQVVQADLLSWAMPVLILLGGMSFLFAPWSRRRGMRTRLLLGLVLLGSLSILSGCSFVAVWPHPQGITGQGVNVVLLDTGLDIHHPDLNPNYQGGYDFVNNKPDPQDDNGHGTAVAGVLAAAENGFGIIGVAPNARVWEFKILDANEEGSISDLLRGLDWAIAHHAQIVNMSLGTSDDNPAMHDGIKAAAQAGILMTAAAGNKGDQVLFPAAYPEVIAVAATTSDDRIAWFSNKGPQVELAAPGTDILSTALHGKYGVVNGTSFAAPHVAGVAALLFSAGVKDPQAVRRLLDATADDLGLPLQAQGYGLVDAWRAYQQATQQASGH
jgi:hypothetical protein